jgi:hypothetical protein
MPAPLVGCLLGPEVSEIRLWAVDCLQICGALQTASQKDACLQICGAL